MKVLFIGGTGIISSACSELAIQKGFDLYHFNRGKSNKVREIEGVKTITGDIRNFEETQNVLKNYSFDVVVDWIAFTPEHIENDIKLFSGKLKQFVFISSASAYQTPPKELPVTENTPLENPFWEYSRNKIACEKRLEKAYRETGFPYTVVRPSHTYDKTLLPITGEYTALYRMMNNKPVIIPGEGTSIWTLTHHKDFAVGLVGLLGKEKAIAQAFHITNDELLSWNRIYELIAEELNVKPKFVHIPCEFIAKYDKEIGDGLLGDKMHSMIFDNSKIKNLVPEFKTNIKYKEGVKEVIAWYNENLTSLESDKKIDKLFDRIIEDYSKLS